MDSEILFEKFKLISCIKKNDFSAVYLADHIFLGRKIFLKTLNTEMLPDSTVLQRFKREAKILAQLEHPHIIKVFDFGGWEKFFYISFEYFESRNLRSFLTQGRLNDRQKEKIAAQLCEALSYAHKKGVVHRDLKPENILINERLQVKVADFGLAILKGEAGITEATSVVGTPAYMSPEQISGKKLSAQSDLFSLGVILFELFSGKHLFLGEDAGQTLNNILTAKQEEIEKEIAPLPQHIRNLLSGMLQKEPARRFGSAQRALEFLPGANLKDKAGRIRPGRKISLVAALALLVFLAVFFYPRKVVHNERPVLLPDTEAVQEKAREPGGDTQKVVVRQSNAQAPIKPKTKKVENNTSASPETKKKISYGKLWVECLPWAKLTIDSAREETTPLSGALILPSGKHHLLLSHPAYPSYTATVLIDSGGTTVFKVNLDTLMGYLHCNVNPWGDVYLDGKMSGQSPFRRPFKLQPGKHRLLVRNPNFEPIEKEIFIEKKDTLTIDVNFAPENRAKETAPE